MPADFVKKIVRTESEARERTPNELRKRHKKCAKGHYKTLDYFCICEKYKQECSRL